MHAHSADVGSHMGWSYTSVMGGRLLRLTIMVVAIFLIYEEKETGDGKTRQINDETPERLTKM